VAARVSASHVAAIAGGFGAACVAAMADCGISLIYTGGMVLSGYVAGLGYETFHSLHAAYEHVMSAFRAVRDVLMAMSRQSLYSILSKHLSDASNTTVTFTVQFDNTQELAVHIHKLLDKHIPALAERTGSISSPTTQKN